mmetsp:Transcript_1696/g.2366  ORF Transcript_1696/g.2366 Transcript_1696/m.2366 type:complete len:612 (+) Transcript_1696:42-1877(+)
MSNQRNFETDDWRSKSAGWKHHQSLQVNTTRGRGRGSGSKRGRGNRGVPRGGRGRGGGGRLRRQISSTVVTKSDLESVFGQAPPPPTRTTPNASIISEPRRRGGGESMSKKRSGRRFSAKIYNGQALNTLLEHEARAVSKNPNAGRPLPPLSNNQTTTKNVPILPSSSSSSSYASPSSPQKPKSPRSHRQALCIPRNSNEYKQAMVTADAVASSSTQSSAASSSSSATQPLSKSDQEYQRYLALSKHSDFSSIPDNIIYRSGYDKCGRPIVVVVASNLPAKNINLDLLLLYVIDVADKIVEHEYTLVFCNTNMSASNRPNIAWLRKAYAIFNRKYKKNLKAMYIVHPGFWTKTIFKCFKPFVSSKFWKKFQYIEDVYELYAFIDRHQIDLPQAILNYKPRKRPVFGMSIEQVLNVTHSREQVPFVVTETVQFLYDHVKLEGLFRISGARKAIDALRAKYDNGESCVLSAEKKIDPHVVAGLLKLFFRESTEPVFPFELYDMFVATHEALAKESLDGWIKNMGMLISQLPKSNRATLIFLFKLLSEVEKNSAVNKMSFENLAIVFGPTLFRSPSDEMQIVVKHAPIIVKMLEMILKNQKKLFEIATSYDQQR